MSRAAFWPKAILTLIALKTCVKRLTPAAMGVRDLPRLFGKATKSKPPGAEPLVKLAYLASCAPGV